MRIFKTKNFERFAQKQNISDDDLQHAITQMEQGLIDANLGNGVFKQRIAKQGQGKSSGYRTIIFYRFNQIAFFVMGFEKSQKANLNQQELYALKHSANHYFALTEHQILKLLLQYKLVEVPFNSSGNKNDKI